MTIQELACRGASGRSIARMLEVTEGTVRCHLRRQSDKAVDGRSRQSHLASGWHERITASVADSRRRFTGHERDAGSGLDYMLARYCNSGLARFLSPDKIDGEPKRPAVWNKYAALGNNPLNRVDPDGNVDRGSVDYERQSGHYGNNTPALDTHEAKALASTLKDVGGAGSATAAAGGVLTVVGALAAQPEIAAIGIGMMNYGTATSVAANTGAAVVDPTPQNVASVVLELGAQAVTGKAATVAKGASQTSKYLARGAMEVLNYASATALIFGLLGDHAGNAGVQQSTPPQSSPDGGETATDKGTSGGAPGPCVTSDGKACSPGNTAKEDGSVDINN